MYYYIFDPPRGPQDYQRTAQIKERLTNLGIAGEMTSPMPGRGIPELIENAVKKRYGTIVVVGDSPLINQVAREILPHNLVMGIIPFHGNDDINTLIGSDTWEAACNHLKRRRWHPTRLGVIEGDGCFLTPATIRLEKPEELIFTTPTYRLRDEGPATIIASPAHVHGDGATPGEITVTIDHGDQSSKKEGGWLSSLFSQKKVTPRSSRITAPQIRIETNHPQEVVVAGANLYQTPLTLGVLDQPLRLISASGHSQDT